MIYLASPYSDPSIAVKEHRFIETCRVAGEMIKKGLVVYSPIVHNHLIARYAGLGGSWKTWERHDLSMIKLCDSFWILTLEGWQQSRGVKEETDTWKVINPRKPVEYLNPITLELT